MCIDILPLVHGWIGKFSICLTLLALECSLRINMGCVPNPLHTNGRELNLNSILNPLIQGPWNLKSFCHRLPVIYFHYTLSKLLRSHFFFNYNLWLTRYLYKLPNKSVYCVYMTKKGNLRTLKPLQEDSTTKHDKNCCQHDKNQKLCW